jgi:general secretion pathway protein E
MMRKDGQKISESDFVEFLRSRDVLSAESSYRILAAIRSSPLPFDVVVTELGLLNEANLAEWLRTYFGVPQTMFSVPFSLMAGLEAYDLEFARTRAAIPIGLENDELLVALANPLEKGLIETLSYYFQKELQIRVFPRKEILAVIDAVAALSETAVADDRVPAEQAAFDNDVDRLKDIALEAPIINFVAKMAQNAFDAEVTDIHIEPFSDRVQIRYRRDGVLSRSDTVQRSMLSGIVTRIKILSGLNIVERRLPQDGRLRLSIRGTEIDFRVSIVPSMHGETIVLRLLRNLNVSSDLSALGFDDEARRKIFQLAQSSNGMVVVTGPTGSGKTTTLYSLVSLLNKEGVKIFTIEDPVEYQLEGVTQLQVNSAIALDFARALRSVLRQDPDIILVGEIRDKETAQIAIQAALTGHLVLTTLHTNTAAGAFTRLRDMGIEEYLIASTIRGVVAQRLVRLLCPSCRDGDPPQCPTCRGTHYSGRTVIYEVLEAGGRLSTLLGSGATEAEIVKQAVTDGMTTMAACASSLIEAGVTSKLEVSRVLNTAADT